MRLNGVLISSLLIMGILSGCQATTPKPKTTNTAAATTVPAHATHQGYYIDHYQKNLTTTKAVDNPAVTLLQPMLKIWQPTKQVARNKAVQQQNLQISKTMTNHRSANDAKNAYFFDRRNYAYSLLPGLGVDEALFIKNSKAQTTIKSVPSKTPKNLPTDHGTGHGNWANPKSALGPVVKLVNATSGQASNATAAKNYYQYPRPFRQSTDVNPLPSLKPAFQAAAKTDYGFPSGHTTKAYETGLALAYAVPERYQSLLLQASTLGNSRIIAGWHSPLDVMGGRMLGTAMTTSVLNDKHNATLRTEAYQVAHSSALLSNAKVPTHHLNQQTYLAGQQAYAKTLTYGFKQIGDRHVAPRVPKGAETLLATRLPYLTADQRRAVLATTELPSGYPLLDDTEGYGRLNLYQAAAGYGQFKDTTTVNMDANRGGFNATDTWRNVISGQGGLVKNGSGALTLTGDNTYQGSTTIKGGTLIAANQHAFGQGDVTVTNGIVATDSRHTVIFNHNLTQNAGGQLIINLRQATPPLQINGQASFAGTLKLNLQQKLKNGTTVKLISFKSNPKNSHFSRVLIRDHQRGLQLKYGKHGVWLTVN